VFGEDCRAALGRTGEAPVSTWALANQIFIAFVRRSPWILRAGLQGQLSPLSPAHELLEQELHAELNDPRAAATKSRIALGNIRRLADLPTKTSLRWKAGRLP
jgi:hypothetical protein